jgi:hypothetical protein
MEKIILACMYLYRTTDGKKNVLCILIQMKLCHAMYVECSQTNNIIYVHNSVKMFLPL